eukprot:gene23250-30475_t
MAFTTAMHTYLHVASATDASLVGLKGVRYLDNLQAQKEVVDEADCVEFKGEVDRAYIGAPSTLTLVDSTGGQVFEIKKHENLPDAVVWNPWIEKAKGMADFGDEEYKDMVCVETALAGSGAVTVGPGESWEASQTILSTARQHGSLAATLAAAAAAKVTSKHQVFFHGGHCL